MADDEYLRPVLEDDSLLFAFEDLDLEEGTADETAAAMRMMMPQGEDQKRMTRSSWADIVPTTELERLLLKQVQQAEDQLFAMEVQKHNSDQQFQEYRARVKESFFDTLEDATARSVISQSGRSQAGGDKTKEPETVVVPQDEGNYFNSYAHSDIHQQMLNVRTWEEQLDERRETERILAAFLFFVQELIK